MSALQMKMLRSRLPPMPPPGVGGSASNKRALARKRDYTPVSWQQYFARRKDVKVSGGRRFRVYESGTSGPVLLLLHGGGFSALSWAVFSKIITSMVTCQVLAFDMRGHGDTVSKDDGDLSAETLSNDIEDLLQELYNDNLPPIILIGHSMGGAVAVHTAYRRLIPSLVGLIVIDVVEGTALDALQGMQSFLRGRPTSFRSPEHAIEWCIRSGVTRNLESAKVSMVGQIKRGDTNELASTAVENIKQASEKTTQPMATANVIYEDGEEEEEEEGQEEEAEAEEESEQSVKKVKGNDFMHSPQPLQPSSSASYVWRINLSKTERHWAGWFQGLSNMFLCCDVPKMLLLAGVDRLDRELTVGQMQGKFQMQVLPQVGHTLHEDSPDKVADLVATYMVRHKFVEATDKFQWTFPAC
ncbi:PREDICTED: protein phosphatase methylesterase 1-like [Priapulus caudatus]|uniref:Protein phosphatase methylesterase 1 n=1 Tax=Priapulus caudatus TaxID=37621 RepID=A0ABM1E9X8_PRICU|nr:PREDICTED: protein phosphatase methylesterase 1-like [Priapulus caudatus]